MRFKKLARDSWEGFLAPLRDPDAWVWIGLILGMWFTLAMAYAYVNRCQPEPVYYGDSLVAWVGC
jgi:hypothetical protein